MIEKINIKTIHHATFPNYFIDVLCIGAADS